MDPRIYYPSARNGQFTLAKPGCGDCAPSVPLPVDKSFITHREAPTPGGCVDEMSWAVWLPEVIVGLEEPNEEIAANYVRQAAIQFCRDALVLQRQMHIRFAHDGWAVLPQYKENEQIIKVLNNPKVRSYVMNDASEMYAKIEHFAFHWHESRCHSHHWYNHDAVVLFCAAPTEFSQTHDSILYQRWRAPITEAARISYVKAYHFKNQEALRALSPQVARANWALAVSQARNEVIPFDNGSTYHPRRAAGL